MPKGTLKRLAVTVALGVLLGGAGCDDLAGPPAGRAAPDGTAAARAEHRSAPRRRPPVEEGCRELPAPAPAAPPPPATCS